MLRSKYLMNHKSVPLFCMRWLVPNRIIRNDSMCSPCHSVNDFRRFCFSNCCSNGTSRTGSFQENLFSRFGLRRSSLTHSFSSPNILAIFRCLSLTSHSLFLHSSRFSCKRLVPPLDIPPIICRMNFREESLSLSLNFRRFDLAASQSTMIIACMCTGGGSSHMFNA